MSCVLYDICHGSPPRAWGRRFCLLTGFLEALGSPPRAWGRRVVARLYLQGLRFTPTGVGTARRQTVCALQQNGSPPRAWGRLGRAATRTRVSRFTPTGVGTADAKPNARQRAYRFTPTGVGTAQVERALGPLLDGSPPRAWGRLTASLIKARRLAVHPHGRGDGVGIDERFFNRLAVHPHGRGDGF